MCNDPRVLVTQNQTGPMSMDSKKLKSLTLPLLGDKRTNTRYFQWITAEQDTPKAAALLWKWFTPTEQTNNWKAVTSKNDSCGYMQCSMHWLWILTAPTLICFMMPLADLRVVGMKMGTGMGTGMKMGVGVGAVYKAIGVGKYTGIGTGISTGLSFTSSATRSTTSQWKDFSKE